MRGPSLLLKTDKLSSKEQLIFLEYLRQTLKNGFSLNASFKLMPEIWPAKKEILIKINEKLEKGEKLSNLLLELGFSKTIATQINLALIQGSLEDCVTQLVVLTRLKIKQMKKIRGELAYPAVLVTMMLILLGLMQTFLKNEIMVSDNTSDILFGIIIGAVVALIIIIGQVLILLRKQDYYALKNLRKYPIIGKAVILYVQYLVTYDLCLLLKNGFSLQQMCFLFQGQTKGSMQQVLGEKVRQKIEEGESLVEIIDQEIFLPQGLKMLVQTGSTKSENAKRCLILGKTLYYELTLRINKMVVNVQPICFIFIGACILGMYLKILLPMYSTMQNI
ncbi:type II secretion system protein F [Lactobacillus sp. PV037]|uniref:type II secretion system F family protein n=1 Tax=unclassified Lactobacillus TaxID=2620435 RepID=UPI00223FAC3B|nr:MULTISPECIES: type II secretion system F family protein [unclassified Lactobacillus]QNQ82518.1 type II secretion system protein F [Lactobacillus sp. PV012]QNQ83366.1 type II secretion system protein F [Lactobacillus sp. PV037]